MEATEGKKVVVIMGPTGSGKTSLSISLARHFNGEIINSDKIQLYKGLDITTNKVPVEEQLGVPHHLLGGFDSEVSPAEFRSLASITIARVAARGRVPIIVGGSNSFIYALLASHFLPNVFSQWGSMSEELRYSCCFISISVSVPTLNKHLEKRVDEIIELGMEDELAEFYRSEYREWAPDSGMMKAIGVPEFRTYFLGSEKVQPQARKEAFDRSVTEMKQNTCQLAKIQAEKIQLLKKGGWNIRMLNATRAFDARVQGSKDWSTAWNDDVVVPSINIVKDFLEEPSFRVD